jgi:hypothetical protein
MVSDKLKFITALPMSLRQRRLAMTRTPIGEIQFVTRIREAGGDADAASFIYQHLLDWIYVDGFTPYPDDRLGDLYGLAEEERDDDIIREIFKKLDVKLPTNEVLAAFGDVDTPAQISRLVQQALDR